MRKQFKVQIKQPGKSIKKKSIPAMKKEWERKK